MKETATAVGAVFSGLYSAFLGGMAAKLAIEGIRRSFSRLYTSSPDPEASNSGYDGDQSSSASETGGSASAKKANKPRPRGRKRCPCPCQCLELTKSKKEEKTHRRDTPKKSNYKQTKTTAL